MDECNDKKNGCPFNEQHLLWREVFDVRLETLERKLDANTEATEKLADSTKAVVDLLQSWKGAMRILQGLSKILTPLTALFAFAAAVWTFFHLGDTK